MVKTKEIDISDWAEDFDLPSGSELTVTIRRLTYGQFTRMTDQMIQIRMQGKNQITSTSPERGQMLTLLYGLEKAPFAITEAEIANIPSDLGQFLYEEIDNFNSRGKREKN